MPIDLSTAGALALLALVIWLPGLALLQLAGPPPRDAGVRWGLAAGLGLAVQPLAYLWFHLARVSLGPAAWWVYLVVFGALWLALRQRRARRRGRGRPAGGPSNGDRADGGRSGLQLPANEPSDGGRPQSEHSARRPLGINAPQVVLAALVAAALAARWWAARDLTVPLFGDSVHHTMIVRLFTLHGGLVDDWEPLAPLSSFTYHFGFHAIAATLVALSGLPETRAVLVVGQALMVLQVLTLYALAAGLTGRPWAGVAAALAACGLSPMPGFYLNWGRYTQLAGQVLLPAAALATIWAAEASVRRAAGPAAEADDLRGSAGRPAPPAGSAARRLPFDARLGAITLAAILAAGLALTHYVVAAMFALLVLAWWLAGIIPIDAADMPDRTRRLRAAIAARVRSVPVLALIAALSVVAVGPWLPRLAGSVLGAVATAQVQPGALKGEVFGLVDAAVVWGDLQPTDQHVGFLLLGLVLAALVAPRVVREPFTRLGAVWLALLFIAAYPRLVGLPLRGPLKDFTLAIGLYLPLGLVLGGVLGDGIAAAAAGADGHRSRLEQRGRHGLVDPSSRRAGLLRGLTRRGVLVAAGVAALGLAGLWLDRSPVEARFVYATPADLAAIDWIRAHTPKGAVFLVSSAKAFGDTVIAGDDGGWWLPLLADRQTTLPPVTYGLERTADPDYRVKVNALFDAWHEHWDSPAALAALDAFGVTHAYVGPTAKGLDRGLLAASPNWRRVYAMDGAEVYERAQAP